MPRDTACSRVLRTTLTSDVLNAFVENVVLLAAHARRNRIDDARSGPELLFAILDAVSARNPREIGICRRDIAVFILKNEQSHGPVEAGVRIRSQELHTERRIPEDQKRRGMQVD